MNKPTNQQTLTALDESIAKWKGIVNGGQANMVVIKTSCALCYLIDGYACPSCIISNFTSALDCDGTPFYGTSNWNSYFYQEVLQPNIADNQMLVILYEIRRNFIIKMFREDNKK